MKPFVAIAQREAGASARVIRRWQDDRASGASVRLGPFLLQVRRSGRIELYIAIGKASALVTL